jgi:N-acetylmuramoyl-L-alanine amidase
MPTYSSDTTLGRHWPVDAIPYRQMVHWLKRNLASVLEAGGATRRRLCCALVLTIAGAVLVPGLHAQSPSNARAVFNEAVKREAALRQDMEAYRAPAPADALLQRIRTLAGAYADMSRLFPTGEYSDRSLWQGAMLLADAYWHFGEPVDRQSALSMFDALASRFPESALNGQAAGQVVRLKDAVPAESSPGDIAAIESHLQDADAPQPPPVGPDPSPEPATRSDPVPSTPGTIARPTGPVPPAQDVPEPLPPAARPTPDNQSTPPASEALPLRPHSTEPLPSTPAGPVRLTAIRGQILPETLRVTLELEREVRVRHEQLDGPPRLIIDLQNTTPGPALREAGLPAGSDLITRIRLGRHSGTITRVVLDLRERSRYAIYALENPYRIVVDFESRAEADPGAPGGTRAVPDLPPAPGRNGVTLSRQLGLGVARVVIDAGHGGHDPGTRAYDLAEAEIVLDVALRLERLLQAHTDLDVVLTRRTDTFVPLEERTALANRVGADLFLSIHVNASTNVETRGFETYFLSFALNAEAEAVAARENASSTQNLRSLPDIVQAIALNDKIDESRLFATTVQRALHDRLQHHSARVKDLGVKQAPFVVLVGAEMPAALAEISFLTNREDAALLSREAYRQEVAEALFNAIRAYQQSLEALPDLAGGR